MLYYLFEFRQTYMYFYYYYLHTTNYRTENGYLHLRCLTWIKL